MLFICARSWNVDRDLPRQKTPYTWKYKDFEKRRKWSFLEILFQELDNKGKSKKMAYIWIRIGVNEMGNVRRPWEPQLNLLED